MALRQLFRMGCRLVALSLILVATAAQAQLSEAERKERCENNQARLDEINAQIEALALPLTAEESRQATDDTAALDKLQEKKVYTFDDFTGFAGIAYRYDYNPKPCLTSIKACGAEVAVIINARVLKSGEDAYERKQLEASRKPFETNLTALNCRSAYVTVVGDWNSDYGAIHVSQDTGGFRAVYDLATGGYINGRYDGHRMTGIWTHTWSEQSCRIKKDGSDYWGNVEFVFADDGKSFTGKWSYCDEPVGYGTWNGTKQTP